MLARLPRSLVSLLLCSLTSISWTAARRLPFPPFDLAVASSDLSPRQDDYDLDFPDNLPTDMGIVFPDPSESLYAGRIISVGFVDPVSEVNATIKGVFRLVTPVLTYSNRTSIALEPWGTLSMTPPPSSYYPPVLRQGWCSVTLFPKDVHTRDFLIPEGLEDDTVRLTLNVTWGLPTYNGKDKSTNCTDSPRLYRTYFLSHFLSISSPPLPTYPVPLFSPPPTPVSLTTSFAPLSTLPPPAVPARVDHSHDAEKRNFAVMGAILGVGAVLVMVVIYWAARRRRRARGEGEWGRGEEEDG